LPLRRFISRRSIRGLARLAASALAVAITSLSLAGCATGYLARAAYEEGRLLWNRKPIDEVMKRNDLPADIRAKLQLVLAVRRFARDNLGLNVGGAYASVTNVDKGAIVWVVIAAPRTSLEPYTWWFPIVGSVPYRGYFDRADAQAEAASLEARGYDTMVRSAVAFSSLGFFDDPLLSNLLRLDRVELAGVIIHELFHRTYYMAGNAMFDESAATYVGGAGAIAFFDYLEGSSSPGADSARFAFASDLKFGAFLNGEAARLTKLYQSGLPEAEILQRRAIIFSDINSDYARLKPTLSGLERFDLDKTPVNNAVLIDYLIYFHELDNFAALQKIYGGDLKQTVKAIIALAKSDTDDPFGAIAKASRPAAPQSHPASSP